jgi:hypothetical protein
MNMNKQDKLREEFDEEFGDTFIRYQEPDIDVYTPDDVWDWIQKALDQKEREVLDNVRLIIASYSKIDDIKTKELLNLVEELNK